MPTVRAELQHTFGEIEVVFGLCAVVPRFAIAVHADWGTARHYIDTTVNYTVALFVVVFRALASTPSDVGREDA